MKKEKLQYLLIKILLVGDETVTIGAPYVEGATVEATVEKQGKERKVTIYKYENTYFTEFHDNGIYYDIESTNVSFEDFKYILDI